MQIGAVAKKIGLSVDAIRFYERNSLLQRAPRTEGGFRLFGENDIETLAFIRRVQSLGFKLREIRSLLELRRNSEQPCAPVRERLQAKLADVHQKLADLQKLEHDSAWPCATATESFAIARLIALSCARKFRENERTSSESRGLIRGRVPVTPRGGEIGSRRFACGRNCRRDSRGAGN